MPIREFDEKFEGLSMHCYEGGTGFPILLLHGSGAGTSSSSNWALVLEKLAGQYHVLAADLIGFGRSAPKPQPPYFDIPLWTRQVQFLLERLAGKASVGMIGHSLSGFLTLRLAAKNANVTKAIVTGCPGTSFRVTRALELAWSVPRSLAQLRELYSYAMADCSKLTAEFYAERLSMLQANEYGSYFSSMFSGEKQRYLDQLVLGSEELSAIDTEVLFVHGIQDQMVPFGEVTLPLVRSIRNADALLLGNCGHGPALEQPAKFLGAVRRLFG